MLLDTDTYEQARQSRDPHFDGRIFIGVLTTGIYCRPVCPVRVPRQENIRIYASAAAAAEAGFRPCLRCRPESAPGLPWSQASGLLSRALQRIAQGYLDDNNASELAAELGISSRQLNRLFRQHLGVTPGAVAGTQRLHFAKKLIDETTLPMHEVCYAAGFSSVRRFNAAFRDTWQRTPLSLRRQARQLPEQPKPGATDLRPVRLLLHYRPPFAWQTMLDFLAQRAIPGVERVSDDSYARTLSLDGVPGYLRLQFSRSSHSAMLEISAQHTRHLLHLVQKVRQMFDLNAVSSDIDQHLGNDPLLQPIVSRFPGTRVPVAWDGFEIAVRAILGQQVSVRGATTLVTRLVASYGEPCDVPQPGLDRLFPAAAVLARATMSGLGITGSRIAAIQTLAGMVARGGLPFDGSISTQEFVQRVTAIRGIGPWTAQYIALRALNDADAFPDADLILLRAAAAPGEVLKPAQLQRRSESWRPWRAYAVMNLWHYYARSKSNA